jgi:hypothetical protein
MPHLTLFFPRIAWPLKVANRAGNAALITLKLDVVFEPVEVRLGLGLKLLYHGAHPKGMIDATAGEERSVPKGSRPRR